MGSQPSLPSEPVVLPTICKVTASAGTSPVTLLSMLPSGAGSSAGACPVEVFSSHPRAPPEGPLQLLSYRWLSDPPARARSDDGETKRYDPL